MNAVVRPYSENEIDLVDLYLGLRRHWRVMLTTFLLLLGLSVVLTVIWPQKYSYSAVLSIGGRLGGSGIHPLEAPESVMTYLQSAYLPAELGGPRFANEKLPKIKVTVPKGGDIVLLQVDGTLMQGALLSDAMQAALNYVIKRHSRLLDDQRATIKSGYALRLEALNERIQTLRVSLAAHGLAASDKALIEDQLQALSQAKINLKQDLQEALDALQPTELVHPPQRGQRPVSVGHIAIMTLGILAAGICAIIMGLLGVFMDSVKRRERVTGSDGIGVSGEKIVSRD